MRREVDRRVGAQAVLAVVPELGEDTAAVLGGLLGYSLEQAIACTGAPGAGR